MLGWERWTLTHSSAGDAVLVLSPVLVLLLGLVLEAALTSSVAAVVGAGLVAVAELAGEADMAGWLTLAEGDTDGVAPADMSGWLADDGPAADVDADPEGDAVADGEGDGVADGEGDGDTDDDGEGDEVACAGSTWHTVSVAAVASGTACALLAMPRARKLPLSRITAALTGGKRIRVACLR